jgi:hypothetical protein
MRVIMTIFAAILGLFAAFFVADKSVRFAQKNVKRYITIR